MDTALIEKLEAEAEALETNEEINAFKARLVDQYDYSPLDAATFVGLALKPEDDTTTAPL